MMRPLPAVRVIEAIVPIPIGYSTEIRVELLEIDGVRKMRVRVWDRVTEAEDVALHVVAIEQLIASLAAGIVEHDSAARFLIEASDIVGTYLRLRENSPPVRSLDLVIVPPDIVRVLRESGILARYNVSEPETLAPTLDLGAWVPADEVLEAEDVTDDRWAEVVLEADRSRVKIHDEAIDAELNWRKW